MTKKTKHIIELDDKNEKAMQSILDAIPVPESLHHGPPGSFTKERKKKKETKK